MTALAILGYLSVLAVGWGLAFWLGAERGYLAADRDLQLAGHKR